MSTYFTEHLVKKRKWQNKINDTRVTIENLRSSNLIFDWMTLTGDDCIHATWHRVDQVEEVLRSSF